MNKLKLSDSISNIPGVGSKKKDRLEAISINNVDSLLSHYPYKYKDKRIIHISNTAPQDKDVLVCGLLIRKNLRNLGGRRSILEAVFRDEGGNFVGAFFSSPYLMKSLNIGTKYCLYGKMRFRNGVRVWTNPDIVEAETEKDKRGIIPVYRCTSGITNNDFNKWIEYALCNTEETEWLDPEQIDNNKLCSRDYALRNIHFPESEQAYKAARFRIIYDDLLCYQLAIRLNSRRNTDLDASIKDVDIKPFIDSLKFNLTDGQTSAVVDIEKDLINNEPMNRLLQGDVGSGKTVVAECAVYKTVFAGYQAAFMAPTEILAKQHYANISRDLGTFGITVALLTSSMKANERRAVLAGLASGEIDVIVGTHALIQNDVEFNNLALIITDEQHRFGVNQRKSLVAKGRSVNALVMSATPIPRTLAATVYGDMDFSIIRTKPANRLPIITKALEPGSRGIAYAAVREELKKGNRAYVIAPSIDSEDDDITSVELLFKEMKEKFADYKIALLHGRLSSEEKDNIMSDFAKGKIQLIVATVVIEVGIDVPEASIIVIENSDRFGLAQMHQLRGRVGRSAIQSYCWLINYSHNETAIERAQAMTRLSDGFDISEEDFRLRGPGDIMGTMQHGAYQNRIINLCKYENILNMAIEDADKMINKGLNDTQKDYIRGKLYEDNSGII